MKALSKIYNVLMMEFMLLLNRLNVFTTFTVCLTWTENMAVTGFTALTARGFPFKSDLVIFCVKVRE